mmetsp:Transcript_8639/g.11936  ORF Transcript_8639/g.11936 Transcript_8639/m.11936 type:complete len:605 (+) Transcript_8639:156-1970(+)
MDADISLSFKDHNLCRVLFHQELDGKHLKSYQGYLERGTANDNRATRQHCYPCNTNKLVLQNSSLVLKYELKKKLKKHEGCVNTIQWSQDGQLLVTGSDDCRVCIWDSNYTLKAALPTGHFRNIFSAKFVPGNNNQVVSTGMDGEVRLVHVETPTQNPSVLLGSYDHMMYKVTFLPDSPAVFLSTHEDGCVRLFDIREKPGKEKLTLVKLRTSGSKRPISANSLAFCPLGTMRFVLGGADPYIRLFDMRKVMEGSNLDSDQLCVLKMCPQSVLDSFSKAQDMYRYSITGVDYGVNQVVATYSRENVYVFSVDGQATNQDVKTEFFNVYTGRRNVSTFLKEVQFIGNRQYVATGSDCGNLFIWHKDTADLVQLLKADENVVNGVAEHPYLPTLAVCGIDHTGKIFEPSEHITYSPKRAATVTASNEKKLHQQEEGMTLLQFLLANFGHAQEEEEEEEEPSEWDMKLSDADELRLHANDRFREGNFEGAISLYDDALNVLNAMDGVPQEVQEKRQQAQVLCMNNKAACYLKLHNNHQVVQTCNVVLQMEPDNVKALYRRGTASMNLGDLEQAEKDLNTALQLCPDDPVIKKLLQDLAEKKSVKKDS